MIPKILWLWVPLIWLAIQTVLELSFSERTLSAMHSENGPHELLQFLVITVALVWACRTLAAMDRKANTWLTAWIAIAALCCFYVAAEEISWGQQFLNWGTPEFWTTVNDQNETNLHNTSSWLDQKPRLILLIGIVTGGLIVPWLRKKRPGVVPVRFNMVYPPDILAVTAALGLGIRLVDMTARGLFDVRLFARASEVEELYMFYFVMLYLMAMKQRLVRSEKQIDVT